MPTDASRPSTPSTGAATPCAPAWISPERLDVRRPAGARPAEQDRLAGGPLLQRVTRADPVGHVVVGPGRLDHRDRERLAAVGDREVRGAAEVLGQPAQHRRGQLAEHRLEAAGQGQHAEPDVQPAVGVAAGQPVLLEGGHQPVDDRAVDADLGGQRGDAQAARRRRPGCAGRAGRGPASGRSRRPWAEDTHDERSPVAPAGPR